MQLGHEGIEGMAADGFEKLVDAGDAMRGLVVEDKAHRVLNFHKATLESFIELMAASGVVSADELSRAHINRRVGATQIQKYSEIYPEVPVGQYLDQTLAYR